MSETEKIVRSRTKSLRDFHIALISQNDSGDTDNQLLFIQFVS